VQRLISIETKELKRRVRDIIDPSRNLGHVDGHPKATAANSTTPAEHTEPLSTHAEQTTTLAIPKAINRLQDGEGQSSGIGERRFTPMDVDIKSRHVSSNGDLETFGESQKKGGKEGAGFCRPGDEDCG
jgi:hypothetical protein